jgi:hypothetical protein
MAGQYAGETIPKCKDGVYDPHGDQRYCSVCRPTDVVAVVSKTKRQGGVKIAVFKNHNEIKDQAEALLKFVATAPVNKQPDWYTKTRSM